MRSVIRRLGVLLSVPAAVAGFAVAFAPSAAALPPNCGQSFEWGVDNDQNIWVSNWVFCFDPDSQRPLQAAIQRYVSPGVWTTVSSGFGDIRYECDGHAYNVYRVADNEFADTCG